MRELISEYILPHFGAFVGLILTGIAGFLFGKKRQNAELQSIEVNNAGVEIDNTDKMVGVYQKILDDLTSRYEAKYKEITDLYESKVKILEEEIAIHKRIIKQLKEENTLLRKKLKDNNLE